MLAALKAQTRTIYTPKGSFVKVTEKQEGSASWISSTTSAYQATINQRGWDAEIVGNASLKYNCHGYAFHASETTSSNRYWMEFYGAYPPNGAGVKNDGSISRYLDPQYGGDGSYVRIMNPSHYSYADKVVYRLGDAIYTGGGHSADFDADPVAGRNWDWVSKFGPLPLVRHALVNHDEAEANLPMSEIAFFAKKNGGNWGSSLSITGPSSMVSGVTKTYTLIGKAKNRGIRNISISNPGIFYAPTISTANGTITLKSKSGHSGNATITYILENGCNETRPVTKSITVTPSSCTSLTGAALRGPSTICEGAEFTAWVDYVSCGSGSGVTVNWNAINAPLVWQNGCSARFLQLYNDAYVTATVSNSCGQSKYLTLFIPRGSYCGSGGYSYRVGIDKVSDALKIELSEEANRSEQLDITVININGQEVLRRKGVDAKGLSFNTSHLSRGVYIIKMRSQTHFEQQKIMLK